MHSCEGFRTPREQDAQPRAPQPLTHDMLVRAQNTIVDPRFAESGYRTDQSYVGQSLTGYRQVAPWALSLQLAFDRALLAWS